MSNLFKNVTRLTTFFGINKLLYLLLTIIVARRMGVEGLGKYGFVFAFIGLLFMISELGRIVAIRELIKNIKDVQKYFWNILLLRSAMSIIAFISAIIFINYYPVSWEIKKAVYLLGLTLLFSTFSGTATAIFYAFQNFKLLTILGIVGDVATTGSAILLLLVGKGLLGIILGFIFGSFIVAVISMLILCKSFVNIKAFAPFDFNLWKTFIKKGFYFIMQIILQAGMFRTDILVLSFFGGFTIVGIYQTAYKISFGNNIILGALLAVMFPQYVLSHARSHEVLKKDYRTTMFLCLILALLVFDMLIIFSDVIVYYVYGPNFLAATEVIKILAVATAINALNGNNFVFFNALKKEKLNAFLIIITFVVNVVMDIVLVKPYGIKGVAMATLFCTIAYFIISTVLIQRWFKKTCNNL